ncbi:MAG TPA: hypothetical protein VFL93_07010 [Longimicrobiaceae bacterium]|nr:hypothetical protein [Longimicrobiaceae bacterium]
MIQRRSISLGPAVRPAPTMDVGSWWAVLRRRWPVGAGLFLAVAGLAAGLVLLSRPIWRAETALRLGAQAPIGGLSLGDGSPSGLFGLFQQMSGDPFSNELELLSSRTVIEGVVEDNALNVTLLAPRGWYRDSLFTRLSASRETGPALFEVSALPDGRFHVRRTEPSDSTVGDFAPGVTARFGGITVAFRPARAGVSVAYRLRTVPFGEAVRATSGRLRADRERREANLVKIVYDDPDPNLALAVVRSATERYTALRAALQRRESGETTDSLRTVANRTLAELTRQENALARFQHDSRLIAPDAQSDAFVKRQADVEAALETARGELARTDDVLARLDTVRDPARAWAGLVAHPTFLENRTLGDLLGNLVTLQQKRLELSGRRTDQDRQVQALDRQIDYLDGSLRSLVRQYRDGVADQVRLLAAQRSEMDSTLARIPSSAVELARRQRNVRLLSEVYLFTDQRLRQESLRDALSFASVQVVDPPEVLFKPVWPRRTLGLGVGLLLAMTFGVLGMAFTERADHALRSGREVGELVGAPVLAVLGASGAGLRISARERRALDRLWAGKERPGLLFLAPVDDPAAAEAVALALAEIPADVRVAAGAWDSRPAPGAPAVAVGAVLDHYAAAAEAAEVAEGGAEVMLVVRYAATRREDVARAAALLGEAGVAPAGVVMVSDDERAAGVVWR